MGSNRNLLWCAPAKEYPKKEAPDCPVPPPAGREVASEHTKIVPVRLTVSWMKQAARYAFYNCSRTKGSWNKETSREYLRQCGFPQKVQERLIKAAAEARGKDEEVDYGDATRIGGFQFPATWIVGQPSDLDLEDYVEAVMHLLYLGIAEDLLELGTLWMKAAKNLKFTDIGFRRSMPHCKIRGSFSCLGWQSAPSPCLTKVLATQLVHGLPRIGWLLCVCLPFCLGGHAEKILMKGLRMVRRIFHGSYTVFMLFVPG